MSKRKKRTPDSVIDRDSRKLKKELAKRISEKLDREERKNAART